MEKSNEMATQLLDTNYCTICTSDDISLYTIKHYNPGYNHGHVKYCLSCLQKYATLNLNQAAPCPFCRGKIFQCGQCKTIVTNAAWNADTVKWDRTSSTFSCNECLNNAQNPNEEAVLLMNIRNKKLKECYLCGSSNKVQTIKHKDPKDNHPKTNSTSAIFVDHERNAGNLCRLCTSAWYKQHNSNLSLSTCLLCNKEIHWTSYPKSQWHCSNCSTHSKTSIICRIIFHSILTSIRLYVISITISNLIQDMNDHQSNGEGENKFQPTNFHSLLLWGSNTIGMVLYCTIEGKILSQDKKGLLFSSMIENVIFTFWGMLNFSNPVKNITLLCRISGIIPLFTTIYFRKIYYRGIFLSLILGVLSIFYDYAFYTYGVILQILNIIFYIAFFIFCLVLQLNVSTEAFFYDYPRSKF